MATGPEAGAAAGHGHFRAAHVDRERVIDTLKTAFADGRLTKDELDTRAGRAFTARTYAELAALTADIPAGPPVLFLTLLALIAVPFIIGNAAITSWQQRHPRGQLPPRPGQGGQVPTVQRYGSTAHDPSPPGTRTDQTRAVPVPRRARPAPGAA